MAEKSDHDLIIEIHQVLKDPDNGLCVQIKEIKSTVYGNGKMGLRTQVIILWGAFVVVGGAIVKILVG